MSEKKLSVKLKATCWQTETKQFL